MVAQRCNRSLGGRDDLRSFLLGCEDAEIDNSRPRSEIIRNYGLLIAAFWGAALAVWRGQIANQQAESASRQAKTASQQVETASRQVEISERSLRNDQFQRGAEMLGSNEMTIRLGGVYALENLAQDYPQDHLDQAIKILAAFVRHRDR